MDALTQITKFEHILIDFTEQRNRLLTYLKNNDDKLPSLWSIKSGLNQLSDISNEELIAIAKDIVFQKYSK